MIKESFMNITFYTDKFKQDQLKAFTESNLSTIAFARSINVPISTFCKWVRKYNVVKVSKPEVNNTTTVEAKPLDKFTIACNRIGLSEELVLAILKEQFINRGLQLNG